MKKHLLYALLLVLSISNMAVAQKFINVIKAPPAIMNTNMFEIDIDTAMHNFNPNGGTDSTNAMVPTLSYNKKGTAFNNKITYLGPTMFWRQGQKVTVDAFNNLKNQSTTMHFHGLNLPSTMDGGPHEVFGPQSMWDMPAVPSFKVIDPIQTVWYHSHLMDSTTIQVIMGLAGMIIIHNDTDMVNLKLPRNYGVNDFPIVIQEKNFNFGTVNGQKKVTSLVTTGLGQTQNKPGIGPYTMVNGLLYGAMHVPNSIIRLRFLNGSPQRAFRVGLSDSLYLATASKIGPIPDATNLDSMWLVATDGGYLKEAYGTTAFDIAPGERYEMLVNLSGNSYKHGDTVYMYNLATQMAKSIVGSNSGNTATPNVAFMALVIDTSMKPANPINSIPTSLVNIASPDTSGVFKRRTKNLNSIGNSTPGPGPGPGTGGVWTINGQAMNMDLANDTILVGTKEIWTIRNLTSIAHPFHIHKIQFQVLDISDTSGNVKHSAYSTTNPLPEHLRGFKDVVLVPGNTTIRYVTTFNDYGDTLIGDTAINIMNGFMYHCHILTHEDSSMMHQFVVLDTPSFNKITGQKVGLKQNAYEKANLVFYPNPTGSVLNIKGNTTKNATIKFTDILGRTLREEKIGAINGSISLQVDDLPRGFVFVEYQSGNARMIQKILLQ
jgi:FtsP/CotA-like multicopper oxidase with cupredoxin domain